MKTASAVLALAFLAAFADPVRADDAPKPERKPLDVSKLFATTCGWCHSSGGRKEGKGPQLMNTKRSDEFIRNRIIYGKAGAMPSFGGSFSLEDIDDIIAYIRALKPE